MSDLRASIPRASYSNCDCCRYKDADVTLQMIPAIIKQIYPDLSGEEEEVRSNNLLPNL